MENHHGNVKGVIAIVMASFLWGTTGTVASYSHDVNALAIGAFSMGVGGVLLVIMAWKKLVIDYKRMFKRPKVLFLGVSSVVTYPLSFYSSMQLSGVVIGTVISIAMAPFFTAILERLISHKKISLQWGVSFVIGAIGIAFLTFGKEQNSGTAYNMYQQSMGVFLGGIAALSYAGYSWAAKRLIESGVHSQSSMSGLFGCAALLLLPSLWFTGGNLFSSPTNVLVSLYTAVIPMFLGYLLFGFGLGFVDASKATLITLIEPLVATVFAVLIIGEKLKVIGWGGITLVSLCLVIQTIQPQSKLFYMLSPLRLKKSM
ncbi:DMT family transporter [Pseudoalteromonas aurantia]|uniref:Drug/metabolite transporter, DME family n=1 Tax=Pseudoalteromonas aurantia 208 TaxID=1314867 RepID=A0ABR9ED91_9GAMM|nr:EamA family transporter [Pseudoalteromonas aurantia]MBE0368954.1 drug/metabolite transporter, DME family [Pseudoalteromonas aurantia 208]